MLHQANTAAEETLKPKSVTMLQANVAFDDRVHTYHYI